MARFTPAIAALSSLLLAGTLCAEINISRAGTSLPVRVGDEWMEVWVDIENLGPQKFEGQLEVELMLVRGKGPRVTKDVEIGVGMKRLFLPVYSGFITRCEVRVRLVSKTGEEIDSHTRSEGAIYGTTGLPSLVILAPPDKRPSLVAAIEPSRMTRLRMTPIEGTPELLPEHWQGWTSAALIVASEFDFSTLSEEQRRAIRDWVVAGGRILFLPGAQPEWLRQPFIQSLAPTGPVTESADTSELKRFFTLTPETIYAVSPESRSPLGFMPGFVQGWAHGEGMAAAVLVDMNHPDLRGQGPSMQRLGEELLRELGPAESPFDLYSDLRISQWEEFAGSLSDGLVHYPPTGGLVLVLLVYVVLAGPVNFMMLRKRHLQAWTVVTVPALGILTTLGLIGVGRLMRDMRVTANRVTILSPVAGSEMMLVREHCVVATGGRKTVELASGVGPMAPMTNGKNRPSLDIHIARSGAGEKLAWNFEPLEPTFFYSIGYRPLGTIRAFSDGDRIRIINESTLDLVETIVAAPSTSVALGPLKKGGASECALPIREDRMRPTPFSRIDRTELDRVILSLNEHFYSSASKTVVIAVAEGTGGVLSGDGSPVRIVRDHVIVIIPVEGAP